MDRWKQLVAALVPWHKSNKRELPWRVDPSPYHTWLSEIMLQQTRIEAVIPYYYRFLEQIPTVADLAKTPDEQLMKLWEGLGYYSRARNLKKAAQAIMEQYQGELPTDFQSLRKLPGIGDYTAGAIASMAFGQPEPAVDGNVLRVVCRIMGDDSDILQTATKRKITELLRQVYPTGEDAGAFTEGLMELGETVCIPNGAPRCNHCPVHNICLAFQNELTHCLPVRSEKKKRKTQDVTVFILHHSDRFALHKRPSKGILAGMWELPNVDEAWDEVRMSEFVKHVGGNPASVCFLGNAKHIFTHLEWHMIGYSAECNRYLDEYLWVTAEELLHTYALPTAFRYYKDIILTGEIRL